MPTPESELFKAKKPTVPPTFDGVDYDDNKALKAAQDAIIREQWVKSMMARLVREEMGTYIWIYSTCIVAEYHQANAITEKVSTTSRSAAI